MVRLVRGDEPAPLVVAADVVVLGPSWACTPARESLSSGTCLLRFLRKMSVWPSSSEDGISKTLGAESVVRVGVVGRLVPLWILRESLVRAGGGGS